MAAAEFQLYLTLRRFAVDWSVERRCGEVRWSRDRRPLADATPRSVSAAAAAAPVPGTLQSRKKQSLFKGQKNAILGRKYFFYRQSENMIIGGVVHYFYSHQFPVIVTFILDISPPSQNEVYGQ